MRCQAPLSPRLRYSKPSEKSIGGRRGGAASLQQNPKSAAALVLAFYNDLDGSWNLVRRFAMKCVGRFMMVGLLFGVSAQAIHGQQPFARLPITDKEIDASLRVEWYGVYLQGKKIGYLNTKRERVADGVQDSVYMLLKLKSFNKVSEMSIKQSMVFASKAPYEFLRGEFIDGTGPAVGRFAYKRTGPDAYEVTQSISGETRTREVKEIDYNLADVLTTEIWLRSGPENGGEIKVRELSLKEMKLESLRSKILGSKTSLVGGVPVKFHEVESESSQDGLAVHSLHDSQGRMLSGKVAIFDMRLETEAQAKNTEYSQDLFVMGMARVTQAIGDNRKVRELVLDIDGPSGVFEDGPRQSVAALGKGKVQLRLGKRHGKEVKATPAEIEENLKETSQHHVNDPKVKAVAAQAIAGAKTDAEKIEKLVHFTHSYIKPTMENGIPTIHDLMLRKKGDCKSYGLLFTNLARAVGIPAREVSGLMYMGDDSKAFGGHVWNEVVLDGVWTPIDAAFDEVEIDATHLCFGTEKRAAKGLLESMGKLKMTVASWSLAP